MLQKRILTSLIIATCTQAFVIPQGSAQRAVPSTSLNAQRSESQNALASAVLATSLIVASASPLPAEAYVPSDYASDTVQQAVQALKDSSGKSEETYKAYENIFGIITEGKGVGGAVNYQGIQLERGYVADEDTSIYNPGLTLLTESEKERLVDAVIQSRKAGLSAGQWSESNEFAYEFLKTTMDPLHMVELSGFLGFVPFYGAILYMAVLAVQQISRDLFTSAYLIGVVAFFAPMLALVAAGP